MEASPEPASPLNPVSDRAFASALGSEAAKQELSAPEQRNRERAADNLSHVFALRDSSAFDWYLREGLDKKLAEADKALKIEAGDVNLLRARWRSLAELRDWLTEAEIHARRKMDPKDPEIQKLGDSLLLQ